MDVYRCSNSIAIAKPLKRVRGGRERMNVWPKKKAYSLMRADSARLGEQGCFCSGKLGCLTKLDLAILPSEYVTLLGKVRQSLAYDQAASACQWVWRESTSILYFLLRVCLILGKIYSSLVWPGLSGSTTRSSLQWESRIGTPQPARNN